MTKSLNNGNTTTSFIDNGDQLIIEQKQDISAIIEHNKALYNQSMDRKGWNGNNAFAPENKVASIPLVVFAELEKQGITRGFQVLDMDRFKAFLNNPDNQVFRTRMGTV
jgi:hypothetical protein